MVRDFIHLAFLVCFAVGDVIETEDGNVTVGAVSVTINPQTTYYNLLAGSNLYITCSANCDPPCQYRWHHANYKSNGSYLSIQRITMDMDFLQHGPLVCLAFNDETGPFSSPEIRLYIHGSAFPNLTSLRYKDNEGKHIYHVLCRNETYEEPDGGWTKEGRVYLAVTNGVFQQGNSTRFGIFESYRRQIRSRETANSKDKSEVGKSKSTESEKSSRAGGPSTTMVRVGHGHFKNGTFARISVTSLSGCGGTVVVGPFPKKTDTANEIKSAAFLKFTQQNQGFARKYKRKEQFFLVYPDGTLVTTLPDGSSEFSLEGYRNFVDPQKRFDRLRLFLCERSNYDANNIESILTDSSSSDELPPIVFSRDQPSGTSVSRPSLDEHQSSSQAGSPSSNSSTNNDDTLPLVVEVIFHHDNSIFKQSFPNNSKASALFRYMSDQLQSDVLLRCGDQFVNPDDRLMELTIASATVIHINIEIVDNKDEERTDTDTIISGSPAVDVDQEVLTVVRRTLQILSSAEEPTLRELRNQYLRGRPLDISDESVVIDGETSPVFIGRYTLWQDTLSEITAVVNLRFPINVQFYGEESADFGGPRKEFFRLAIDHIKRNIIQVDDGKARLRRSGTMLSNNSYFAAGVIVGLSALQNGPCASFLGDLIEDWRANAEEYELFAKGLRRTGLWQMIEQKQTLKYLFRQSETRMTVQKIIHLLKPQFSEIGSNARQNEEKTYSSFIRFLREVAAGRQGDLTLEKILAFVTGSNEEPPLGFEINPSVNFAELPGALPTASTCINRLTLPISMSTSSVILDETTLYQKFQYSFNNEYFGLQ